MTRGAVGKKKTLLLSESEWEMWDKRSSKNLSKRGLQKIASVIQSRHELKYALVCKLQEPSGLEKI